MNKLLIINAVLCSLSDAAMYEREAASYRHPRANSKGLWLADCWAADGRRVRNRADLLTLLLLVPDPQPASAPARIRQVSAAVEVERLPVAPVAFGGAIDLELGLAESLKLLNEYQIATNGLWLEWQQEASDG